MKKLRIATLLAASVSGLSSCALHRNLAVREPSTIHLVDLREDESDLSMASVIEKLPGPRRESPAERPAMASGKTETDSETAQAPAPRASNALRIRRSQLAEANLRRRFRPVRTTAYHHNEADHKKYGRMSAAGTPLKFGRVRSAAADWSRYPLGTVFRIVGQFDACEYVIDDYGVALVGTNTIDLYKPDAKAMNKWGARDVVIEVLEWGSYEESLRIMKDRTKWKHVREMVEGIGEKLALRDDLPERGEAGRRLAMLNEFYGNTEERQE